MRGFNWIAGCRCALATLQIAGCSARAGEAPKHDAPRGGTVLLVSLDGFRWDYLNRGITPNLSRVAREGVRAEALVPVFPTKTFPNHYTIVTGRYPSSHGIVGNVFVAPDIGRRMALWERDAVRDPRFYLAEPIWVSVERQDLAAAPLFWPGSEAAIGGVLPSHALPYDGTMPDTARVAWLLGLLSRPGDSAPVFLTLYSSAVDDAGHAHGPDAPATNRAIAEADGLIGALVEGLSRIGRSDVNLIVLSDHGMASTGPDRVVWLDRYLAADALQADEMSTLLTAWPAAGLDDSVYRALRRVPHLRVYRGDDLPRGYRLEGPRLPPILALADEGWTIARRTQGAPPPEINLGNHGYDDTLRSMRGVFVARGPAFRRNLAVPSFRNIHVYPLLAEVLGLTPQPADGSLDSVRHLLAASGSAK